MLKWAPISIHANHSWRQSSHLAVSFDTPQFHGNAVLADTRKATRHGTDGHNFKYRALTALKDNGNIDEMYTSNHQAHFDIPLVVLGGDTHHVFAT